ncbi:MAG: Gfo/Idh/MocA family oxidoreductase [Pseudomonadota bacterium]
MSPRKEHRLRYFEQSSGQQHIAAEDKYLYQQPPTQLNIAVIGTGTMGVEHIRIACLAGRARIIGVYDPHSPSIEMARAELTQLNAEPAKEYASLDEAVRDDKVDAYIICTPNYTHKQVVEQVLQAGKPILLEKPMATTVDDASEIVRMAQKHKSALQIGLQYRYKPIYQESIQEALHRATIGNVCTVNISEHRPPFLDKVGQWNKFSQYSGGTLVEKCCHYFDLMNLFAGSNPKRVYASGGQAVNFSEFQYKGQKSDIADHAFVTVDYENGATAGFNLNMFSPSFTEELTVVGDRGRITASEKFDYLDNAKLEQYVDVQLGEHGASRLIEPRYPDFIAKSGHQGSSYFAHQQFLDEIAGINSPVADVYDGFWSIVVGVAAERSMSCAAPVEISALLDEYQCKDLIVD